MKDCPLYAVYTGGMLILDDSLTIFNVTPEFCEHFACTPESIVGKPLDSLFSRKDKRGRFLFHKKLSQYKKGFLDLTIVIFINKSEFISRLRLVKREKEWLAIFENILAEDDDLFREFYLGRERWTSIVRNSSEGIAILDSEGRLVEFNSRFLEIMQFRSIHGVLLNESALLNKYLFDLSDNDQFNSVKKYFEKAKTSKRKSYQEIQHLSYYLRLEITPIYLPVKGFSGCSFVIKDITHQKQLEFMAQQLQQKNQELERQKQELQAAHQEIITLNQKLQQENLRLSAELDVTKKLQQMILPKQEELDLIEGLDIAGFMQPADEVGGDYYDVIQQNGNVKISIGDVTGHGLESGVLMLMTQTAVRTLQESEETNPVKFLDILNRTIYSNIQRINPYRNLTLAVLDYANGTLGVSGQHEDIIIVRTGGKVERINTTHLGFPLGLEEEISEFIDQKKIQLDSGDVIVLYTDGVTEAYNSHRKQYGLERLCEIVSRNCQKSAQEIRQVVIDDVRRHIGEQKVADDITLVVLKQK